MKQILAIFTLALVLPVAVHAQAVWSWEEDLRIGALDGPQALTAVSDIEIDDAGRIYVAQSQQRAVVVFDTAGRLILHIGREGGGPGEFRRVDRLNWIGDTLTVYDERQPRLTLVSQSGEVVATHGVVTGTGHQEASPMPPTVILNDGSFLVEPRVFTDGIEPLPLFRWAPESNDLSEYAVLIGADSYADRKTATVSVSSAKPIHGESLWDVSPDGSRVAVVHRPLPSTADSAAFEVLLLAPDGDTLWARAYRYKPVAISEVEADQEVARRVNALAKRFAERLPVTEAHLKKEWEGLYEIPPFQAPVDRVVVGRDGSVWLRRGAFAMNTATWLVLGEGGRIEAVTQVPADVEVEHASRSELWIVGEGEADVPFAARLVRADGG